MKLDMIALLCAAISCNWSEEPLTGKWDYRGEAPVALSGDAGIFVLESKPENTRFEFDGKTLRFVRDDAMVYEMSYATTSVAGDITTVELSTPGFGSATYPHRLFVKDGVLQATKAVGKEYQYIKRAEPLAPPKP